MLSFSGGFDGDFLQLHVQTSDEIPLQILQVEVLMAINQLEKKLEKFLGPNKMDIAQHLSFSGYYEICLR